MPGNIGAVDLGHHERHVGVHAEGMAVIHHHSAGLHGLGQQLLGDGVVRRAEHEVAALERLGARLLDGDGCPTELHCLARAARTCQQTQLANGNLLLIEALEHLRAHRARRTQDGDRVLLHEFLPLCPRQQLARPAQARGAMFCRYVSPLRLSS